MRISELAEQAGVNASAIRYYEQIGLLPTPKRASNGYRLYATNDLDRLRFVIRSRALEFDMDVIREIIDYRERGISPCDYVRDQIDIKVSEVEERIDALVQLRSELKELQQRRFGLSQQEVGIECICPVIDDGCDETQPATLNESTGRQEPGRCRLG